MISLIMPVSPERPPRWTNVAVDSAKKHIREVGEIILAYWGENPVGYGGRVVTCNPCGRPYNGGLLKNFGARKAQGDYFVFLDADAEIKAPLRLDQSQINTADISWESRDRKVRSAKVGANEGMVLIGIPRELFYRVQGFRESFLDWGGEDIDLLYRTRPLCPDTRLKKAQIYHRWHLPKTLARSTVKELNLVDGGHEQSRSLVDQRWWGRNAYLVCSTVDPPPRVPHGIVCERVTHWDQVTARGPSILVGAPRGKPPKDWVRDSRIQIFHTWRDALKRIPARVGRD